MDKRRPGMRRKPGVQWNAHLLLTEAHRDRLEALADVSGATISEQARRALDLGLPLLEGRTHGQGPGS